VDFCKTAAAAAGGSSKASVWTDTHTGTQGPRTSYGEARNSVSCGKRFLHYDEHKPEICLLSNV